MAKAGRGSDQFPLRLPEGLRDRIKAAADRNGRSMNAEIVATLENGYPSAQFFEDMSLMDELDDLQQRLERIRTGLAAGEIDREPEPKRSGIDFVNLSPKTK